MTRKEFLGAMAGLAAAPLKGQAPKPRNIVLILADDHRWDMLGAMGHPWLTTKYLDKMIDGGALFENAFVTTSLCSASRASILTGQYAHSHGVLDSAAALPSSLATFPALLAQKGYRAAMIGKWQIGGDWDEPRAGFARWVSFRGAGVYKDPTLNIDGDRKKVTGYTTDILTEEARKFIAQSAEGTDPFLLILSHKAVQHESAPADRHRALYANEPIPYPKSMANTEANYKGRPQWVRRQRESWLGVDGMYNRRFNFDQLYRDYCRTLLSLDESVGVVMDELSKRKLIDETLIVYMSDNGFQLGEHGLIDKRTMYEPSMRIPLIVHCPALVKADTKVAGMALNIDIAPTLLDVAGIGASPAMHGRSLMPLLKGAEPLRSEFIYEYFWDSAQPQIPTTIGLRTAKHSLMSYQGIWDIDELYDIEEDADQMTNLLGNVRLGTDNKSLSQRIAEPEVRSLMDDLQARMWKAFEASGGVKEPRWRS